ncbi:MAG: hypothetical protein GXO81_10145 [Chlorobi bacterium]|nr:hypothetical protein [Chlorobiota bacterium]
MANCPGNEIVISSSDEKNRGTGNIPFTNIKHLGLNLFAIQNEDGEIDESGTTLESYEQLKVFSKKNPLPDYAVRRNDMVKWK